MRSLRLALLAAAALPLRTVTAQVNWTDWQNVNTAGQAFGQMTVNAQTINVTHSGGYQFVQTSCGTNYWTTPGTYTSPTVPNAPPGCDIVALGSGGLKTISFSQAVVNPVLALVSWNVQPGVVFNAPIEILSQGPGFWGSGTFSVVNSNTLVGAGEAHGTIRVLGTFTSISFTDGTENWHGYTVGVRDLASTVVPEPATWALFAAGLAALTIARRRTA